jgi:hypothetical protein
VDKGAGVRGEDVPIEKLLPLHERGVQKKSYHRLRASIQAVGLIEPLCVYPEGERFVILDGYLRYKACRELGFSELPCLLLLTKEAYTPNRMVNHLTAVQENRMLANSLGTLDEKTIASALGLTSIRHRIQGKLLGQLHPEVVRVFDERDIPLRTVVRELTFVTREYQLQMLGEMEEAGDFSPTFIRTLLLRAPEPARVENGRRKTPWRQGDLERQALAGRLQDAEKRYEFYSGLYRQYVTDLLRLCMYVRRLVTNSKTGEYLESHHPEIVERIRKILFETEGTAGA